MIGFYRLDDEKVSKLPNEAKDIEDDIYDLCCPLVVDDILPKDIYNLYSMLGIPIIGFEELKNYDDTLYTDLKKYIKEFSEYLELNTEIELLEEGMVGHTLRVGRYALELCKLLKLSSEESKNIYIGALFHDVGKTRIPKKILSKPGKLNDKEFEIMKHHSEYGVEIMEDFLSDDILKMILYHHERCDKSGYPKGIMPNRGAKVIGIADSYDAMISKRVYKKNKSLKAAQEELVRCTLEPKNGGKGVLYDEEMVRLFVSYHGYNTLSKKYNR